MKKLFLIVLVIMLTVPVIAQEDEEMPFNIQTLTDGVRLDGRVLSPDGTKIAGASRDALCIIDLDAEAMNCTPYPEDTRLSTANYFAWSPDSTKIALTEEFLQYLYEPDIWVYDLAAQTFVKMTEDDATDVMSERQTALIDFFPVWNPVDGLLYFVRSQESVVLGSVISVQRINTAGDPEQVTVLPADFIRGISVTGYPVFSPDGTQMALPIYGIGSYEEQQGIWTIDIESGLLEQIPLTMPFPGVPSDIADDLMRPTELLWHRDNTMMLMVMDSAAFNVLFYELNLDGTLTPIFDLSAMTTSEMSTVDEPITGVSYFETIPRDVLVNADGTRLYYATVANDNVSILSMTLPPGESSLQIESTERLDIIGAQMDFLAQATEDGRGLLWGAYVLDTGE